MNKKNIYPYTFTYQLENYCFCLLSINYILVEKENNKIRVAISINNVVDEVLLTYSDTDFFMAKIGKFITAWRTAKELEMSSD